MSELTRQIRRQKTKNIFMALGVWLAASVVFAGFIYNDQLENSRVVAATPVFKNVLIWGGGLAALFLLFVLAVLIIAELKDDHKKVLNSLAEAERETLEQEIAGLNLFLLKITVTSSFVILNANGYTLKLIPIKDITKMRMFKMPGARPRNSNFSVIHFHTKSGKNIRSSAIAVTDPIYPLIKNIFDDLASEIVSN